MPVSDQNDHNEYARGVRDFDATVWKNELKHIVLEGFYAKFAQNPAMKQHLLRTGDQLVV